MSEKKFEDLFAELSGKLAENDPNSGSVTAVHSGVHEAGKKLLEEAGEVWLAAEHEDNEHLSLEISQLLYRLQILMLIRGITPADIYRKL
ncbi:MAG: phosphoribosyl-ATP diphosphatase [Alphaproteobacteria bacterium]|nr:phosphoribosyl-ATP diphosphatase [Alphaproteobacteria bacterium]NDE71410.1 phosphoribosyl-ATP diphosphatase [Actinomycetota bacterium]